MGLKESEKKRLRDTVSLIYVDGFTEGAHRVASEYGHERLLSSVADRMGGPMSVRLDLVDKAVESYIELIEKKAKALKAEGFRPERIYAEVEQYARYLAEDKAQLITEIEWAKANMDGAGAIVGESGEEFEWRFPHFDTASPDHEECVICEAIREGSPYSTDEAEAEGYPDIPHPNCDHGWVLVPKGEESRTEEFPMGAALQEMVDSSAVEKHVLVGGKWVPTPGEGGPGAGSSGMRGATDLSLRALTVGARMTLPPMTVSRGTPWQQTRTGLVAELEQESPKTGNRTYRLYDSSGGFMQRISHKDLLKPL